MVAIVMKRTWINGIAGFLKEFLQTRRSWPYGVETHFSMRENLRKFQYLPRNALIVPKSPFRRVGRGVAKRSPMFGARCHTALISAQTRLKRTEKRPTSP